MNLLEQVVCLKLAKELKKLEVKQDSVWVWTWVDWNEETEWVIISQDSAARINKETFSAYTVAELGEILPGEIREIVGKVPVNPYFLDCGKVDYEHSYYVRYIRHDISDTRFITHGYNEIDARAEMLIYLIKERIIKGIYTKNDKQNT
jgi:hypothetical protein